MSPQPSDASVYPCRDPYGAADRAPWREWIVPEREYHERVARVREALSAQGLDGLLVVGHEGEPASLAWLTNYTARFGQTWLLLPLDGEPVVVSNAILHGEPMHSMLWNVWIDDLRAAAPVAGRPPGDIVEVTAEAIRERGLAAGRIAVCSPDTLSMAHADALRRALPDARWEDGALAVVWPRAVKSPLEIAHMRRACQITARGLTAALEAIRPGVSEREIANAAHVAIFAAGTEELGFDTAVSSGPRAGLKHAGPTGRAVRSGELVFLDMGAVIGGYHADLSRCAAVWPVGAEARRLLDAARVIFEEALAAVRPGGAVRDVYAAAERAARRERVFDDYMPNGLGHGLGLSLWELPWLTPSDETIFEAGMIFALEPMLVRHGFGTAVVEETVLVTPDGAETLSGMAW